MADMLFNGEGEAFNVGPTCECVACEDCSSDKSVDRSAHSSNRYRRMRGQTWE